MKQALFVAAVVMLAASGSAGAKPDKHGAKSGPHGYGAGGCPPGLRAKNPECMPPGQHKKLFQPGQRVPYNFQGLTGYDGLPFDVRHRYGQALDPRSRYIYDDHYLYRVDPATMVVSQVLQTVLRP
jgi:hypothetical protein